MQSTRWHVGRERAGFVLAAMIFAARLAVASGDSWSATSMSGVPQGREDHTAVWTGSKMIVWGGFNGAEVFAPVNGEAGSSGSLNTGGIYDPAANTWSPTTTNNAPAVRDSHTAVWTGTNMIVWGGDSITGLKVYGDGASYDPGSNSWTSISKSNAPSARYGHTAVWTGSKMIVWGGWTKLNLTPVLAPEAIISDSGAVNSGAIYDPLTNSWTPISTTNAPSARGFHTAVWTGSTMIVWGGDDGSSSFKDLNSGGIYDPATDTWTKTSTVAAPSARDDHSAIWTGSKMIVWGGYGNDNVDTNTGGIFDPDTNSWTATSLTLAPAGRSWHAAVWTGSKMIVWGGYAYPGHDVYFGNGALYDPLANTWTPMTSVGAPPARSNHTSVWSGSQAIFWGGFFTTANVNSGGIYTPPAPPCPADGGRQCVTPVAGASDTHSIGRSHPN